MQPCAIYPIYKLIIINNYVISVKAKTAIHKLRSYSAALRELGLA